MLTRKSPSGRIKKLNLTARLVITASVCLLCSCSVLDSEPEEDQQPQNTKSTSIISAVRLYIAKGNFTSTEFEQYSLSGNSLFFECGMIRRGKNIPSAQGVIQLKDSSSSAVVLLGMEILGRAAVSNPLSLAEPEDQKSFADSGKVILNLQTKDNKSAQLNTALNEVSDPLTALERNILKLSKMLRAEVKDVRGDEALCGNESFFGIE